MMARDDGYNWFTYGRVTCHGPLTFMIPADEMNAAGQSEERSWVTQLRTKVFWNMVMTSIIAMRVLNAIQNGKRRRRRRRRTGEERADRSRMQWISISIKRKIIRDNDTGSAAAVIKRIPVYLFVSGLLSSFLHALFLHLRPVRKLTGRVKNSTHFWRVTRSYSDHLSLLDENGAIKTQSQTDRSFSISVPCSRSLTKRDSAKKDS